MTTVYVDPAGTALPERSNDPRSGGTSPLPGAVEALARLCDARYDVVVLSREPVPALADLDGQLRYDPRPPEGSSSLVPTPRAGGDRPWMIASDSGWTELERLPGVRTIRVGPKRVAGRLPGARFDLEARDLPAAVMEILVRDTMP